MKKIIVGSRSSKLAMTQTKLVISALKEQGVEQDFEIKEVLTEGDKNLHVPLTKLERGGFLDVLEDQLLNDEIDMAIHSLKDVPVAIPDELEMTCIPKREDHRDAYLAKNHIKLADLPAGAVVGTSSLRRAAQILAKRPDLKTKSIRGPIDSRIEQLHDGNYDAIILAVAGLKRLGLDEALITEYLPVDDFVPAIGQGALAIETRKDNQAVKKVLATIHDEAAAIAVQTERLFLAAFNEGEQAPIGGYASTADGLIHLHGMVISLDGQTVLQEEATGTEPETLAKTVAERLIAKGAMELIQQANKEIRK